MSISLCHINEIPDTGSIGFSLAQANIFAVKKNNKIFLYLNRCPHLGTPLDWQKNQFLDPQEQYIICAAHGALFLIEDGECIQGPCKGMGLWQIEYTIQNDCIIIDEVELPAAPSLNKSLD